MVLVQNRDRTVDPEAVGIAWLRAVFFDENDSLRDDAFGNLKIGRSLDDLEPILDNDVVITVARTGSGGQLSMTGLLWEWELGISTWARIPDAMSKSSMQISKSSTQKAQPSWGQCAMIVDVICDLLSLLDTDQDSKSSLAAGSYEVRNRTTNDLIESTNLIYVRMVGAPRRRPSDPTGWARIDFEVVITMGRSNG